jgi:antitoxin ParD1/3/4
VGQTLGQTASFRQTAPETWCQSRVCGVSRPASPKTVKHPKGWRVTRVTISSPELSTIDKYGYASYRSDMNVNLGTVFDKFIGELLQTGMYQTQSEVVREGLRLLKEREELKQLRLAELRKEIAIGSAQADRGEFVDGEKTFAEIRKRSAGRKRGKG